MTTYPIKSETDTARSSDKVVVLEEVGKKYPAIKKTGRISGGFEDFWALKNIHLNVCAGEILGIIGRNGAGKTTLLNIIAGTLSSTGGRINVNGRVLGLFNLGVGFQDELTGRENVFLNGAILGADRRELNDKLASIIDFSELGDFIDMPLGTYSQGMRLRLGFSIVVNLNFDILVIDEVLAVGDALFQSKCFERLMEFKRDGKTLVIVSQSVELIERLCDRVVLLDHGRLLFDGDTVQATNQYRSLLNTETFFVGPRPGKVRWVENTKKWAEDISNWGKELGTKEVVIEKVEYLNSLGLRCRRIKSGQRLRIKVFFKAKNIIKDPHLGVAIFRNDGVYCYGPNTKFDDCCIHELKSGKGYFTLDIHELLLAPGEYRVSIAVWDKDETLAFIYHEGRYELTVAGGSNPQKELVRIPYRAYPKIHNGPRQPEIDIGQRDKPNGVDSPEIESVKFLDGSGEEKNIFMTNEPARLMVTFGSRTGLTKDSLFWAGIFREDGIYCQGIPGKVDAGGNARIEFPRLPLLPGGYKISIGIWDTAQKRFVVCHRDAYSFRMVFEKEDHGTIYLKHQWRGNFLCGGKNAS